MVHNFQDARQARTGRNIVKYNSPNTPSTWDSSSFVPVPPLPRKLVNHSASSVLAVRNRCHLKVLFCVQKATRGRDRSVNTNNRLRYFLTNKIFLFQVMYRYVPIIFIAKICNNNTIFRCLCSALLEKRDFYCSVITLNCTWYCTMKLMYFYCSILSWGLD